MNDLPDSNDAEHRRIRRSRSIAMALLLGFFVLLIYAITFARMG